MITRQSTGLRMAGLVCWLGMALIGCGPTSSTKNHTQPTRMDSVATQAIDSVTSMGVDSAGIRR